MSEAIIENVYLSIVNTSEAYHHIKRIVNYRNYHHNKFTYGPATLNEAVAKARIKNSYSLLEMDDRRAVWRKVIDYIYCDDVAYEMWLDEFGWPKTETEVTEATITSSIQKEEKEMTTYTIEHKINGRNVEGYTENDLIEIVRETENDIESLKSIKTKSKAIENKIKDAEEVLAKVVEHLDSLVK